MNQAAVRSFPARRFFRITVLACLHIALCGITACSLSGPPPAKYVLGAGPMATATRLSQTGFPIVEIKRIQLPDYLDTTEILERRGNQLIPSPTGRWGERLSIGLTRALTASLAARLPGMVVTAAPPVGRSARQILIDVTDFEATAGNQVILVANWTISDAASRQVLIAEQTSLVEAVAGAEDGAVVAAMSRAVEELAVRLAAQIEGDLRPG
jgi:uncharacterized protein